MIIISAIISFVIVLLVILFVVIKRTITSGRDKGVDVLKFIKENSTRYKSIVRCKNDIESKCVKFDNIIYHRIEMTSRIEFDKFNFTKAEEVISKSLSDEIEFRVTNVKFNSGIMKEFEARKVADYSDYDEEEYALFNNDDVSYEEYLKYEDSLVKTVKPEVSDFFIVTVIASLVNQSGEEIDTKEFSFSMFDAYRLIHVKKTVIIDKAEEKALIKARLKKDKYTCQVCGVKKSDKVKVGVMYVVPLAKGGKLDIENMRTACTNCFKRR